ncbi:hypothetical protein NVS55_40145 (plasmid) [Myxococcus stipitatus]|uniref:hypothetical protein n=1 Tax=Myxococcus stipitatus TaxID=83455 RepID=UPI003144FA60
MPSFTKSDQYELWQDLAKQNGHLRRNNWLHWVVHFLLVFAVFLLATRPLMAVRIDGLGDAQLLNNITTVNAPGPEEAEAVTRLVSQNLLELSSGSVSRDVGRALALMTADFAKAYRAKVQEDQVLAAFDKANVRSQLTLEPQLTTIKAEKDSTGRPIRYLVQVFGKLELYRAEVFTAPVAVQDVTIRATLLVVPRTQATLNGLLVQYFEHELVAPRKTPVTSTAPLPSIPTSPARQ